MICPSFILSSPRTARIQSLIEKMSHNYEFIVMKHSLMMTVIFLLILCKSTVYSLPHFLLYDEVHICYVTSVCHVKATIFKQEESYLVIHRVRSKIQQQWPPTYTLNAPYPDNVNWGGCWPTWKTIRRIIPDLQTLSERNCQQKSNSTWEKWKSLIYSLTL